ncbi:ABC transporter permease [Spirosoma fluviale]|uniref:ABC-type antimicrobial peptide transport system, permease component n=1 Tax=Spirosoma fluviale TaxID=1597977 RepID=A0A286F7Q8_9BACT|nr:ABC transporter permease [Spirosoma fluviale]SOD79039.1 ABC-type antimicrobial peptide transport system, permease component [Spirosoma fluviale]
MSLKKWREDDLNELFSERLKSVGLRQARWRYTKDVLSLMRPSLIKRQPRDNPRLSLFSTDMLSNYIKIAWRNLIRNKGYSFINIGGLAVGMTIAILIGLWIYDELSFNKSFQHYDRIAQVMRNRTVNGETDTRMGLPIPLAQSLKTSYGDSRNGGPFKRVVLSWWTSLHTISVSDQVFSKSGKFMTPEAPEMLSLTMRRGSRAGLTEPASILLSASLAKTLFGEENPLHKTLTIDNTMTVNVTGVYDDLPAGSSFADVQFIAPWDLYAASTDWVNEAKDDWTNTSFEVFIELAPSVSFADVSATIRNLLVGKTSADVARKPEVLLYPMSRWHLYSDWKNGVNEGGRIQFVWLFGLIGLFVLLLACINFMNLSTARSVNRAKEVGIRKAIGSRRQELVAQFFGESLLVVTLAFGVAIGLVFLSMPFFNQIADKQMVTPFTNPLFWVLGAGFALLTGLIAGSYPALYLSSFRPVAVLKGAIQTSKSIATPRRLLVVLQFTVSITLIIGTLIVYRQIQFARNRPIGYNRNGLISMVLNVPHYEKHRETVRNELIRSGAVLEVAESASPLTEVQSTNGGFDWAGKDPTLQINFGTIGISHEFGKTVGWTFKQGRDFSRQLASDSLGIVLNESAVAFMGMKDVLGKTISWNGNGFNVSFHVIGVIRDMVMDSPYEPAQPSVFFISPKHGQFLTMRLNPTQSPQDALATIGDVLKEHLPAAPFNYTFVDDEYDQKFRTEERIGTLAFIFATLAIFISCLGIFGLASFMAEQRTREIGVRKVLGASVLNLWGLLSKDFVFLALIGFGMATPIAWYFLHNWLQEYTYRTDISWWVFAVSGAGALLVTLLTVSFQSIKAALMNPVKSLRSE